MCGSFVHMWSIKVRDWSVTRVCLRIKSIIERSHSGGVFNDTCMLAETSNILILKSPIMIEEHEESSCILLVRTSGSKDKNEF